MITFAAILALFFICFASSTPTPTRYLAVWRLGGEMNNHEQIFTDGLAWAHVLNRTLIATPVCGGAPLISLAELYDVDALNAVGFLVVDPLPSSTDIPHLCSDHNYTLVRLNNDWQYGHTIKNERNVFEMYEEREMRARRFSSVPVTALSTGFNETEKVIDRLRVQLNRLHAREPKSIGQFSLSLDTHVPIPFFPTYHPYLDTETILTVSDTRRHHNDRYYERLRHLSDSTQVTCIFIEGSLQVFDYVRFPQIFFDLFHAMRPAPPLVHEASIFMNASQLIPGEYVAIHLRLGNFHDYDFCQLNKRCEYFDVAKFIDFVTPHINGFFSELQGKNATARRIFVATNDRQAEHIDQLRKRFGAESVMLYDLPGRGAHTRDIIHHDCQQIQIEKEILAHSGLFFCQPLSSFAYSVLHSRHHRLGKPIDQDIFLP